MDVVIGVVALLVGLGVIFAVALWWVRQLQNRRTAEMTQRYPTAKLVVPNASFFGLQSAGVMQMRGNGTMVVANDSLIFELWVPRKQIIIPLKSITGISTPKSFLGKTRFVPLIQVNFRNEGGVEDAAAWQVPDIEAVKRVLSTS